MTVQENTGTAVLDYQHTFGWPVEWQGHALRLVVGSGIGAVAIPRALADRVLEAVARQGCEGPVVCVLTKRGAVAILLAEADTPVPDADTLPNGVRVLTAGTTIPLPSEHTDDLTHWLVPPDTHQRWLPSLTAILASVRSAAPRVVTAP